MNVVSEIPADICVGCGVCTVACSVNHLKMVTEGQIKPTVYEQTDSKCIDKCNICLTVCPFSSFSKNEDYIADVLFKGNPNINHLPECGYYLNSFVGFREDDVLRLQSASGGLTSAILEALLSKKLVDTVLTVKRNAGRPFFEYTVCRSVDEIRSCSGSAYYTVYIGDMLRQVMNDAETTSVVIVALPCMCKSIRNACCVNSKLRKKLKFLIGLTCGQQKSYSFADYLAKKNGVELLHGIHFRTKKSKRPNGNYGVILKGTDGSKEVTFSSFAKEWSFRLFTVQACNYCDDIFAETADAVFMDAWLPEYRTSDKGENLIIVRNAELNKIIENLRYVSHIDISKVINSQKNVLENKRSSIVEHIRLARKKGIPVPKKRDYLFKKPFCLKQNLIRTKYRLSIDSEQMWRNCGQSYDKFQILLGKWRFKLFVGLSLNKIGSFFKK